MGENQVVKIGDFGLTRYVYSDKAYVMEKSRRLPLKWMALEAIFDMVFTSESDVYVLIYTKLYILYNVYHNCLN